MLDLLVSVLAALRSLLKSEHDQALEMLALRQQLAIYKRTAKRPKLRAADRVFIILEHERRRVVHFGVTAHPSAEWTANHVVQAFPFDTAPHYMIRDRDKIYGAFFRRLSVPNRLLDTLDPCGCSFGDGQAQPDLPF